MYYKNKTKRGNHKTVGSHRLKWFKYLGSGVLLWVFIRRRNKIEKFSSVKDEFFKSTSFYYECVDDLVAKYERQYGIICSRIKKVIDGKLKPENVFTRGFKESIVETCFQLSRRITPEYFSELMQIAVTVQLEQRYDISRLSDMDDLRKIKDNGLTIEDAWVGSQSFLKTGLYKHEQEKIINNTWVLLYSNDKLPFIGADTIIIPIQGRGIWIPLSYKFGIFIRENTNNVDLVPPVEAGYHETKRLNIETSKCIEQIGFGPTKESLKKISKWIENELSPLEIISSLGWDEL